MANRWGGSWGNSWGTSWELTEEPQAVIGTGPVRSSQYFRQPTAARRKVVHAPVASETFADLKTGTVAGETVAESALAIASISLRQAEIKIRRRDDDQNAAAIVASLLIAAQSSSHPRLRVKETVK
jgi:hypothetical protein